MLHAAMKHVELFHRKHAFAVGIKLKHAPPRCDYFKAALQTIAATLERKAGAGDLRALRLHLIVEEVAELAGAFETSNEVEMIDALADLVYVAVGTAVAYGVDLDGAFECVHQSNMTKAVAKPDDIRLRDKGDTYTPPDLRAFRNQPAMCRGCSNWEQGACVSSTPIIKRIDGSCSEWRPDND